MVSKKGPQIDTKALSKKYGFSVPRVIKRWKKDQGDAEIAYELEIDMFTLACLRKEIENHRINPKATASSIYLFDRF